MIDLIGLLIILLIKESEEKSTIVEYKLINVYLKMYLSVIQVTVQCV